MKNWQNILVSKEEPMSKIISLLGSEGLRIVLVVDERNHLLGTVTDGDIRRAILAEFDSNTPVKCFMHKKPSVASVRDGRVKLLAQMKRLDVLQIPLINSDGSVVGLETLQDLAGEKSYNNTVFLMAGGFGTRLRPLTEKTPKPLLKVGTKPILELIINNFIDFGFKEFYISTHYKAEQLKDYFGDGRHFGINISYVHEDKPLGTAGSLSLLPSSSLKLPVIMMNGDLLTKINFEHLLGFHKEQAGLATVCVREYDFQVPYGVVKQSNNRIKDIVEKPVHKFFVNAGIYVLEPEMIKSIAGEECLNMPDLIEKHINSGANISAFPIHEYWLDIGRMNQYEQAHKDIQAGLI